MPSDWLTTTLASKCQLYIGMTRNHSHLLSSSFRSYVKSKFPRQGQLYLSLNNLCFYSYMFGKETKFIIRYSEIIDLSRGANSISLRTKNNKSFTFGLLFSAAETHNLIEQLSKMAMQRMIHDPDSSTMTLDQPSSSSAAAAAAQKSVAKPFLLRDFTAQQHTMEYRTFFRLPNTEKLDGMVKANLWMHHSKRSASGTIYLSQNFLCFRSEVKDLVSLIIPLKNIRVSDEMAIKYCLYVNLLTVHSMSNTRTEH